jgi:cytochrome d ubiquinol oxidase subunit II
MGLAIFWFIVVAFFWTGFFALEGFDFGVGVLHVAVGRTDLERRVAINAIGPTWDGNEVWLIVAGASMFAAFPGWYATMFSALYLALVLVLVALIVRGVAFEFRLKRDDPRWRALFTWCMVIGSALVPLLVGIGLGDLRHGLPVNAQHNYTGSFWDLLTGYGIWTGITLLALCLLHGVAFLSLRTTGVVRDRAQHLGRWIGPVAVAVSVGFAIWSNYGLGGGVIPSPLAIVSVIAVIAAARLVLTERHGLAFVCSTVAIATTVISIFLDLYPNVLVSTTNKAYNLTVQNTASGPYALKVMTVVAVVLVPVVLLYQGWSYWVFRKRLSLPPVSSPPTSEARTGSSTG